MVFIGLSRLAKLFFHLSADTFICPSEQASARQSLFIITTSPASLHLLRRLPHRLNIFLPKLPLDAIIRDLPRERRLRDLLKEPQRADRALPIADVIGLDLDDGHAGVVGAAVVDAVTEVAEPGGDGAGVEVLDAGVVVGGGDDGAGDGDPVLGRGVLEGDLGDGFVGNVAEFVGVFVREEEEVGT